MTISGPNTLFTDRILRNNAPHSAVSCIIIVLYAQKFNCKVDLLPFSDVLTHLEKNKAKNTKRNVINALF